MTYKKGDKLKCSDTITDGDKKVRFIKDKVYEIIEDADAKGRYGWKDEEGNLTRWGAKWFELIGGNKVKEIGIVGMNTKAQTNVKGTHKCTCDFYSVIVVTGCRCNGV